MTGIEDPGSSTSISMAAHFQTSKTVRALKTVFKIPGQDLEA
jgi:hypothetical protein